MKQSAKRNSVNFRKEDSLGIYSADVYFIPFVRDSANAVNATMILTTTATDTSITYLCDWQYRDTVSTGLSSRSQFLLLMNLDKNVFGERMYQIKDTTAFGKDENNKTIRYVKLTGDSNSNVNDLMVATTVSLCYSYWYDTYQGQVTGNCNPELAHCLGYERRYRCDNYTVWTFVEEGGGPSGGGTGSSGGGGNPGGSPTPPNCGTVPVDPLIAGRVVDPCDEGPGWIPVPIDDYEPPAILTSIDITSISDSCLLAVINHIGASGHQSAILKTYFNQNLNSTGPQKKYSVKYFTDPNLIGENGEPSPGHVDVTTLSDGTNQVEITLNTSLFQNTTKEWVTAVILHELLHGIISVARPDLNTNKLQHIHMFNGEFPKGIAQSLIELFPGINAHDAIALGIEGLSQGYLIDGTNTIDPAKDSFAQE